MDYVELTAQSLPIGLAKTIIEEDLISKAVVTDTSLNGVMYYLFELHSQYFDPTGQYDNWNCPVCKDTVLSNWKRLKPYLKKIVEYVHNNTERAS